jgi:predicted regulator of Ras-like GTPase activity (Roadblock/LC7/MglB family)
MYIWVQFWLNQEVSKFINHCNEVKAATVATKDGGYLSIVKTAPESASGGADK